MLSEFRLPVDLLTFEQGDDGTLHCVISPWIIDLSSAKPLVRFLEELYRSILAAGYTGIVNRSGRSLWNCIRSPFCRKGHRSDKVTVHPGEHHWWAISRSEISDLGEQLKEFADLRIGTLAAFPTFPHSRGIRTAIETVPSGNGDDGLFAVDATFLTRLAACFRNNINTPTRREHQSGAANHGHILWSLMVSEDWMRRWEVE